MQNLSLLAAKTLTRLLCIAVIQSFAFSFASAQPTIASFSPASASLGVPITITGSNFDPIAANNIVYVGGLRANIVSASSGALVVQRVAAGDYSAITVTTGGLTAYSANPFITQFPGFEGLSSASFAAKKVEKIFSSSQSGALGDFDGDGKLDIAMTETGFGGPNAVSFLRNTSTKGKVSFDPKITMRGGSNIFKVAVADFNGDGKPDVALMSYLTPWYVLKNTSTPGAISFAPAQSFNIGISIASDIKTEDLDGDGRPEIIGQIFGAMTGKESVCIVRNTSSIEQISFATSKDYPGSSMSFGDLNGDGKPEMSISNILYENKSVPGSLNFVQSGPAFPVSIVAISDIDGDGKNDLVTSNSATTTVYKNSSATSINLDGGTILTFGLRLNKLGDINGDGKPDFVAASTAQNINPNCVLILNTSYAGNVRAGVKTNFNTLSPLSGLLIGDIDSDGMQDIIANGGDSLAVYRNISGEPLVAATGSNPVSGEIITSVTNESAVPVYNNKTYLKKRYDIEPLINASTATATLTLAYSQDDFDAFNALPSHGMDLPSGPDDLAKKANLRIFQHHGTSATGVPGSYSGSVVEINPDDSNIIWNDSLSVWQVTFNVEGFSGFFAGSESIVALPTQLTSLTASSSNRGALLRWTSQNELNVDRFEIEKSEDGFQFIKLSVVFSKGDNALNNYQYVDINSTTSFFRLKIVDHDGSFVYSKIVRLSADADMRLTSYPNPVSDKLSILVPLANTESDIKIVSKNGQTVKSIVIAKMQTKTDINVEAIPAGSYNIIWSDGKKQLTQSILIQKK